MGALARGRQSLPRLFYRPDPDRRNPKGRAGRGGVRLPCLPPPAGGALSCRPRQARLEEAPPAVAAAQYHYLSNWIGGVHVEYMYESDRKAWIRYPPPRWIWQGTA